MTSAGDDTRRGVAPRRRLVDDVTRRLRDMIIAGELRPGQQLTQLRLSEQLGVSRTPLREAFRVLEGEGLIRTSNRNRTVEVVQISPHDLFEIFQLREAIDGLAARLAAERGVSSELAEELHRLVDDMAASSRSFDSRRRAAAHLAFHSLVVELSGNPYVEAFAPVVRASSAGLYFPAPNDLDADAQQDLGERADVLSDAMVEADRLHLQIAEAIIARDGEAAEQAARAHIRHTMSALPELPDWIATMARRRRTVPSANPSAPARPVKRARARAAARSSAP